MSTQDKRVRFRNPNPLPEGERAHKRTKAPRRSADALPQASEVQKKAPAKKAPAKKAAAKKSGK